MSQAPFPELSASVGFSGNPLDRLSERRDDAAFQETLRRDAAARCLVIVRDMPILKPGNNSHDPWFTLQEAREFGEIREEVLLGRTESGPKFAVLLDDSAATVDDRPDPGAMLDRRIVTLIRRDDVVITDLRSVAVKGLVDRADVAMLAEAKSILHWHNRHRFCSNCGAPTRNAAGGWRRECATCQAQHFPRTDPVVIMLVTDGDRCLMGRQARFGKGMYSALAGFLEPGETVEEAVRREVREEAGIEVGPVQYVASQPWPFPASLMIGCIAQAKTRELTIDRSELEDARWFTRKDVKLMLEAQHPEGFSAPQPLAIAHHLVRHWTYGA